MVTVGLYRICIFYVRWLMLLTTVHKNPVAVIRVCVRVCEYSHNQVLQVQPSDALTRRKENEHAFIVN